MHSFVIIIVGFVGLVRSDVGYRYNAPLTSYDVPFRSVGSLNNEGNYQQTEQQVFPTGDLSSVTPPSIESTKLSTPSSILQTPIREHTPFTSIENPPQHKLSSGNELSGDLPSFEQKQDSSTVNIKQSSSNQNSASSDSVVVDSQSTFGSENSQQVVDSNTNSTNDDSQEVQRHLYFYSAPEEPEEVQTRIVTPPPSPKKNVKILFIKTPTFNPAPISISALPQYEDKTLVYVLVKKPEEQTVVFPTASSTKPTKPEVYFIKYKTQKEAQESISSIQNSQQSVGIEQNSNVYSPPSPTERTLLAPISGSASGSPSQTALGESSGIHVSDGQNELTGIHAQINSLGVPEKTSTSDAVAKFDGSLNSNDPSSEFSGRLNVQPVYGPPRNRRYF